jgi:hypothetical protein
MADEIVGLLENNKLRQEVIENIKSLWSFAGTLYENPDEEMEKYVKETGSSLWNLAWDGAEAGDEIHKIEQAFDEYVIQKMAKPYRLTFGELVGTFFDLIKPDEQHYGDFEKFSSEDCNNLYAIFVNYVKNHILSHRYSDSFPICLVANDNKELHKELVRGIDFGYRLAMSHAEGKEFQPENISEGKSEDETVWDKNDVGVRLKIGPEVVGKTTLPGKKTKLSARSYRGKYKHFGLSGLAV